MLDVESGQIRVNIGINPAKHRADQQKNKADNILSHFSIKNPTEIFSGIRICVVRFNRLVAYSV